MSVGDADRVEDAGNSRVSRRLRRMRDVAADRGARAFLVLECAPIDDPGPFVATECAPRDVDRADRVAARLGTEHTVLVHDARERLDPGLLAAEAGTVPAGGALVLLTPALAGWAEASPCRRFVARLVRQLRAFLCEEPAIICRTALRQKDLIELALDGDAFSAIDLQTRLRPAAEPEPGALVVDADAQTGQDRLLQQAARHLRGDARALIVIEAPRGRGKSALLGRLSAGLARDGVEHRICAVRRSALGVLVRHRGDATDASVELPFIAPDAAALTSGDVLLVDEAASLPLPVIERLLGRWSRLVLASTTAGYESSGRAFALKLPALFDRARPGWLRLAPTEPLRWRNGDPLDRFITRVLAPATSTAGAVDRPLPAGWRHAPAREQDREALAVDESSLAAHVGLLVSTHYQSTPLDLAHLLDAQNLRLWSIQQDDTVLAAALVAVESGVPARLHEAVMTRRRRLPHDLLPQLLAQCADRDDALDAALARVVRIAVRRDARRDGLASRLLKRIVDDVADDVEGVGASFGESSASLALWSTNGFDVFHRGYRHNPRSGRRSIAVLAATSGRVAAVLHTATAIHHDNHGREHGAEPGHERAVSPNASRMAASALHVVASPAHDAALLVRFASGQRSLWDTRGALRRLLHRPGDEIDRSSPDSELVRWLQALGSDVPHGRRARESRLRERIASRVESLRTAAR